MPRGIYNHKATKTPIYTEERNEKIGEALSGKLFSEETRRKMSDARRGKHHSEETRRQISETHKQLGSRPPELRFAINGKTLCEKCHQWKTRMDNKIYQGKVPELNFAFNMGIKV